jgi:hypothetical protein
VGNLLDIVHHRKQLPLRVHLGAAPEPEAAHPLVLEVGKNGFNSLHALAVDARSCGVSNLRRTRSAAAPGHQAALRALACKWVCILLRCWQTGEPYDESPLPQGP